MQARLERDEGHLARARHDGDRHVGQVVFFEHGEVEQRRGGVGTAADGADKVGHGDAGGYEGQGGRVDTGVQEPSVLLEHLDVDVDLGARVERGLHDGLKGRFDRRRELQDASERQGAVEG